MIEWVMNWDGKGLLLGCSCGYEQGVVIFFIPRTPIFLRCKMKFLLGRWAAAVLVAELELS